MLPQACRCERTGAHSTLVLMIDGRGAGWQMLVFRGQTGGDGFAELEHYADYQLEEGAKT